MSEQVKVLRVVEYTGDRAAVERLISQAIQGEKVIDDFCKLGTVTIKAATLGLYPEVLSSDSDMGEIK